MFETMYFKMIALLWQKVLQISKDHAIHIASLAHVRNVWYQFITSQELIANFTEYITPIIQKNTILPPHNVDSTMKNGIKLGNTASKLPVNLACLQI